MGDRSTTWVDLGLDGDYLHNRIQGIPLGVITGYNIPHDHHSLSR